MAWNGAVVEDVMLRITEADRWQVFVIDERVVRGKGTPVRKRIRAVQPPTRMRVPR